MKKSWVIGASAAALVVAGGLLASRGGKDKNAKPAEPPFRVGKVQAEDLQVSVREVGVIDPETKVDVKSAVSGRLVSLKVREGAVVKTCDVLAEVEPDVTQAQSLSDVSSGLTQTQIKLKDAERELAAQKALFESGLIGQQTLKDFVAKRDLASQSLDAARSRYQIVESHGIPISGGTGSQKARVTAFMDGVVPSS